MDARTATTTATRTPHAPSAAVRRIGCVSFLNAKPLIDGLENLPDPQVRFDVPSRLLHDLETGLVDIALCPVIDYQRAAQPLVVVPVGGIGCEGTTLTVRLYSMQPLDQIEEVHADTDSHTSVALMRVILARRFGRQIRVIDYHAREHVAENPSVPWPTAMLLIGDKVVTDSPPAVRYPHQLDLGYAWRELTGLPFVFAVWMARQDTNLGDLPARLDAARRANADRIRQIVDRHAAGHGWPDDLAMQYLGRWLRFEIGPRQLQAMRTFWTMSREAGVLDQVRELQVAESAA